MVKTKNVGILIILCLFLQIIFIGINLNIDSDYKYRNSHSFFKVKSLGNKVFHLARENLKTPGKTVHNKQNNPNFSYILYQDFLPRDYSNINKLIDFRKYIRQAIPHYFNGSNYKNNYLRFS